MHFSKLKQVIIVPLLAILITVAILAVPLGQDRYSYSRSPTTNSTANMTTTGVDLIDIHPSPLNVKTGNTFELIATVVNNSPYSITLPAGRCDSPLTAFFKAKW